MLWFSNWVRNLIMWRANVKPVACKWLRTCNPSSKTKPIRTVLAWKISFPELLSTGILHHFTLLHWENMKVFLSCSENTNAFGLWLIALKPQMRETSTWRTGWIGHFLPLLFLSCYKNVTVFTFGNYASNAERHRKCPSVGPEESCAVTGKCSYKGYWGKRDKERTNLWDYQGNFLSFTVLSCKPLLVVLSCNKRSILYFSHWN